MKRIFILATFLFVSLSGCQEESIPLKSLALSSDELETLLFTREEEKLAHDVYLYAFEKYGLAIFQNIANSEAQHVTSVLTVMNSFQIIDPLNENSTPGQFVNPTLNDLYLSLTSRVDKSLSEAIIVGLLIEDMDINDLNLGIAETSQTSISNIYSSLKCGSENHLRSFYNQAQVLGIKYTPEFISQSDYDSIINSSRTSCQTN